MALKIIVETILVWSLLFYSGVDGRKLSRKEDRKLEEQLKLLNKPAVKTIKTEHGDFYDCLDFYKQPAFDHPLLKNHNYHFLMKPASLHKEIEIDDNQKEQKPRLVELKRLNCPLGTVPIRRITKADLIREKLLLKRQASISNNAIKDDAGTYYRAGYRTSPKYAGNIHGAVSHIGLYNPQVLPSQFSSGLIDIHSDGDDYIKFGWTVDETVYGSNFTRLFTYFKAGSTSCYNTRCPGFVLTSPDLTPDAVLLDVTTPKGDLVESKLVVQRDPGTGNWWLKLGEKDLEIGFWPNELFTSLKGAATSVFYGGDAFSPSNLPKPPMGSGFFPNFKYPNPYDNGFHRTISYIDPTNSIQLVKEASGDCTDVLVYGIGWYNLGVGSWTNNYLYGGPELVRI